MGISLLNKNVEQLCFEHGFVLNNLKEGLETLLSLLNSKVLGKSPPFEFDKNVKQEFTKQACDYTDWNVIE